MIRIDTLRFGYCYAGGQQPEVSVSKGLVDGGDGDEPGAVYGGWSYKYTQMSRAE